MQRVVHVAHKRLQGRDQEANAYAVERLDDQHLLVAHAQRQADGRDGNTDEGPEEADKAPANVRSPSWVREAWKDIAISWKTAGISRSSPKAPAEVKLRKNLSVVSESVRVAFCFSSSSFFSGSANSTAMFSLPPPSNESGKMCK
eukprot:768468-Hanusia_phi.AAC.6